MESFETLQLHLATTLPGSCRLALDPAQDTGVAAVPHRANAPTMLGDGSLVYLTHTAVTDTETSQAGRTEFIAHAYGPDATRLAE